MDTQEAVARGEEMPYVKDSLSGMRSRLLSTATSRKGARRETGKRRSSCSATLGALSPSAKPSHSSDGTPAFE